MKTLILAVLAVVLGTGFGLGRTWFEFQRGSNKFTAGGLTDAQRWPLKSAQNKDALGKVLERVKGAAADGLGKVFVVNGEDHNFGTTDINTNEKHTFQIKNIGTGPLAIAKGRTTCKCTTSELPSGKIQPGETAKITLEWTAKEYSDDFVQTAEIVTSDPEREVVHLKIIGRVIPLVRAYPSKVVFSDLAVSEKRTMLVHVFSFDGELSCQNYEFTNPDNSEFFDVSIFPIQNLELYEEVGAESGFSVWVIVNPGMPPGPINQNLRLITSTLEEKSITIPIEGQVVGDITFAGRPDFSTRKSLLDLGLVPKSEGKKVTLRLFVKGPHRKEVKLSVDQEEIEPSDVIQAKFGEPVVVSNGKAYMIPLTITIPPNSRTVNRFGSGVDGTGKILIRTTHPETTEIPLYIRFAIGA